MICPAGIISQDRLDKSLNNIKKALGLEPVLGKHILETSGYLAGSDANRLDDLHGMFEDKSIKAIWCIRGGYGCTRLLPYLNYDVISNNRKLLLGYSDVTALHHALYTKLGMHSLHSPVGASDMTDFTLNHLKPVLFGKPGDRVDVGISTENDDLLLPVVNLLSKDILYVRVHAKVYSGEVIYLYWPPSPVPNLPELKKILFFT